MTRLKISNRLGIRPHLQQPHVHLSSCIWDEEGRRQQLKHSPPRYHSPLANSSFRSCKVSPSFTSFALIQFPATSAHQRLSLFTTHYHFTPRAALSLSLISISRLLRLLLDFLCLNLFSLSPGNKVNCLRRQRGSGFTCERTFALLLSFVFS